MEAANTLVSDYFACFGLSFVKCYDEILVSFLRINFSKAIIFWSIFGSGHKLFLQSIVSEKTIENPSRVKFIGTAGHGFYQ